MRMWEEVIQIASTIHCIGEEDSLIWQFNSSGIYSSQSLYKVINLEVHVKCYLLYSFFLPFVVIL
uniref:Uncharacterized protein n=1 Tax=Arundo donax TaxID=35708 RepID=A0A0A8YTK8_ARUDO